MPSTETPDPTDRPADRRKLVAIMHADMVGYSRLIGLDDAGTLQRLRALRQKLIDPAVDEHGGRIVQTGGDSLLIVFDSIDGAVRCAVKVQQRVPSFDAEQPPDQAIRFRVGINLGDAIADGTDLHGDVVNIAARLQTECPPGGICVTRPVRDYMLGRLDLAFEELGALTLKNIARLVEAFVLRPDRITPKSVERSLVQGTSLPLPDRPSIAVLAFDNMSGDPGQEYFSDGIAEDIITDLSRSRSLFVIARNSSFTYRGRSIDVRQVSRELGVRYVVEGSVRRSGARVRVTAQLIDAETGNHIWAERYDRALENVFEVQDEITRAVAHAVLPAISGIEQQRALRRPPGNLGAWEAYQRGLWHFARRWGGAADEERARYFFRRATELDPLFAAAHAMLAFDVITLSKPVLFHEAVRDGEAAARRAIDLDPHEPSAHAALAWIAFCNGEHDAALERAERAISIDANYAWAYDAKGSALAFSGRTHDAKLAAMTALRLSPRDPLGVLVLATLTIAHYFAGDYTEAVATAQRAIRDYPDYPNTYRFLAASLGMLGHTGEAREALRRATTVSRESFEFFVNSRPAWVRPEDHEHMLDGLRKAGWQGWARGSTRRLGGV